MYLCDVWRIYSNNSTLVVTVFITSIDPLIEKKERKHRKPKDKDAPKRPMSAFFCYLKARRDALKKEQPSLSNTEIVSKMTTEWKALSEKEKETYNKSAEKEKERYLKEKKAYDEKNKKTAKKEEKPEKKESPKKSPMKSPKKAKKSPKKKVTKRTAKKKAAKKH